MRSADADAAIAAAVARVAASFIRAGIPVERAELEQAGWECALDAITNFDAARGELGPYLRAILRASLGKAIARWLHPCALTAHAARRAAPIERVDVDDVIDEAETPETAVAEAEARAHAARILNDALAAMPPRMATIAQQPGSVREAAASAGVSPTRMHGARALLAREVRKRVAAAA